MAKRKFNLSVLPGQPLDGTGKVCVHLFVQDSAGINVEPCVLDMEYVDDEHGQPVKQLVAKQARGRLACDLKKQTRPVTRGGITFVTMRTSDPRAVTCPKCLNSEDYKQATELLAAVGK